MKVTNTDHTATNGNHSKCRMAPFSCALCAFARVLSRRCLLLIALYISRQAAKVAKIICNTKQLGGPVCCTQNGHPII